VINKACYSPLTSQYPTKSFSFSCSWNFIHFYYILTGIAQSAWRLTRRWNSGHRFPVEERFSVPVQDRPWVPLGFLCNRYRVCFPGVNRLGRGVDYPPHFAPGSKIDQSYISTPHLDLRSRVNFTFYFTFPLILPSFSLNTLRGKREWPDVRNCLTIELVR
jgi:hypothetical protein